MIGRRSLLLGAGALALPGSAAAQVLVGPSGGVLLVGGGVGATLPPSERSMILAMAPSNGFKAVLAAVTPPVNETGAIGGNIPTYTTVDQQRAAINNLLYGFLTNDQTQLNFAVLALEFAATNQNTDGSWPGFSTTNAQDEGTAFYLATFGRVYLGLRQSPYWSTYSTRLTALLTGYGKAMTWLHGRASALGAADQYATNRLCFDALAFAREPQCESRC